MPHGIELVMWRILYTSQANRDSRKIAESELRPKVEALLEILRHNPYRNPPPYEKLLGDLQGACSRRINIRHRLVYQVLDDIHTVKVLRMWSHYE
jgi:toxin YoeB